MNLLFIISFFYIVYNVQALTSFIEKGKRAELFELLDNEIGVFRVTIPDDEFKALKDRADIKKNDAYKNYFKKLELENNKCYPNIRNYIVDLVNSIHNTNFSRTYPYYNFKKELPVLNVQKNGFSKIDVDSIILDIDRNYSSCDDIEKVLNYILQSNKNFNLMEILSELGKQTIQDYSQLEPTLRVTLVFFKYILKNDDGCYSIEQRHYEEIKMALNYIFKVNYIFLSDIITILCFQEIPLNIVLNSDIEALLKIFDKLIRDRNINYSTEDYIGYDFDFYYRTLNDDNDDNHDNSNDNNNNNEDHINEVDNENNEENNNEEDNENRKEDNDEEDNEYKEENNNEEDNENNEENNNEEDNENNEVNNDREEEDYINYEKKSEEYKKKIKNGSLVVELNGKQYHFKKITFNLAGTSSRNYCKPAYNLKIRGKQDLFGRRHFKLRSDITDPTKLRSKLMADIHNKLGLPSISASYITLYINDEYMGLYILMDAYKLSWIEYNYGEKETTSLYKCEFLYLSNYGFGYKNENDKVHDDSDIRKFLETIDEAESVSEIEPIFEVDHFLTEMAIEYLTGAAEHLQSGHNYYLYKQPNGKWIYLSFDFDLDIGMEESPMLSFEGFSNPLHILQLLIFDDPTRFEMILNDLVHHIFNPMVLFPRIDELKKFIEPYVILDKTPDRHGHYPGRINKSSSFAFTLDQWRLNTEFTLIPRNNNKCYGLKYWILVKYRFICEEYDMDCDPLYTDTNYNPTENEYHFFKTSLPSYIDKNNTCYIDIFNDNTYYYNNNNNYNELCDLIPS